jgi:hypothetical protein
MNPIQSDLTENPPVRKVQGDKKPHRKNRSYSKQLFIILVLVSFIAGLWSGYSLGMNKHDRMVKKEVTDIGKIREKVNPPGGYQLGIWYGDIGPRLLAAGAFKLDEFVDLYKRAGRTLTEDQLMVLTEGSEKEVVFTQSNANFLLNLFWALGLTNQNPVLDQGPIMQGGKENMMNYASTGGWTLAARPVNDLFSSTPIVKLTSDQQERLEEVTIAVYRPCCDNPTHFPDCNHGMAMLGLLELMASQGASKDEMYLAAKYANAYWYPIQTVELAVYFTTRYKLDFTAADARQLVSPQYASLSAFRNVHQWLSNNNLLPQPTGSGNNCGV